MDERPAAHERQPAHPPPPPAEREREREPALRVVERRAPRVDRTAPEYREPARTDTPPSHWDDPSPAREQEPAFRARESRVAAARSSAWDSEPTIRLDDYWASRDARPGVRDRGTDSIPMWAWLILLAFLCAAAYIGYHYWDPFRDKAPAASAPADTSAVPAPSAPPSGFAATEPTIRHPVPEVAGDPEKPLPAVDKSDAAMRALVTDLVGPKTFQAMVNPQQLVRRIVATVDNLPRKTAPVQIRPIKPAPGQYVPSPENTRRYAGYVRAVESLDTRALVQGYVAFYPLFQRAYADLGFPDRYFNDRVVEAIDDMLAAPDLTRPTELIQPKVFYLYADPRLESRSAGQKFMMRLGPENAAKVKAKLREIRQEIAKPVTNG